MGGDSRIQTAEMPLDVDFLGSVLKPLGKQSSGSASVLNAGALLARLRALRWGRLVEEERGRSVHEFVHVSTHALNSLGLA